MVGFCDLVGVEIGPFSKKPGCNRAYNLCQHLVRSMFGPDSDEDPFDSQDCFHHLISKVEQGLQIIVRVVIKNLMKYILNHLPISLLQWLQINWSVNDFPVL